MSFQINDVSLDHVGLDNRQRGGGAKKNLRQGVGNSAVQNVHTLSTVSLASYANPSAGVTCSGADGAVATASDNNRDWSELLLLTSAQLRAMILPSQLPSIQHAGGGGLVVYPMSKDELDLAKNCDYVLTSTGATPFGASGYSKTYGTIKTSHNITNACGALSSGVWGASATTAGLAGVTSLHLPGKVALANEALGPQNECCNTVQTCCGVQDTCCNPCNQWPVNCAPTSKAQVDQNNARAQCLGARTQEDAHALAVVLFGEDYQCGDSLLLGGRLGIAGVPLISISGGTAANAANATGDLVFNRDGVALNPTAMGRTADNAVGPDKGAIAGGGGDGGEAPVVVLNAGGGGDLGLGGNGTALTTGAQNLNACDGVRLFNHGVPVSNLASSNDAARMGKIGYLAPPPELNLVTIVTSASGSISGTPAFIPSIGNTPDLDFVIRATVVGNSACYNANAPDNCCNPYGGRVGTQQSAALNLRQHPGKSQSTILEFDILKATQRSGFAIASEGTEAVALGNGTTVTPVTQELLLEVC